jgi:uncharacterized membrane protein
MVKISSIFVLGLLTALIPFSGFPAEWKETFYILFGLAVAGLSILIRRELHEVLKRLHDSQEIKTSTFSQNSSQVKNNITEEK